jgi:hypothetical protein
MLKSGRFIPAILCLIVLAIVLLLSTPVSAATDLNEPTDNVPAGATKVYFGVPVEGYLGQPGDVDYFYIDVPSRWSPHHVTAGLSRVPAGHDWTLDVALADPAAPAELTWADWPLTKPWTGRVERNSDPDIGAARLYIKVQATTPGDFSADKAYRLQVLWTYAVDSFPDVPADHANHDAIIGVAREGIVEGYVSGAFGPDDPVKRQQFAKMISIYGGLPLEEGVSCPFTDVDNGWPYPSGYVTAAAKADIIKGYAGNLFKPYNDITVAQVVTMSMRGIEPWLDPVPADYTPPFPLFDDGTHYQHARFAAYYGLLAGLPTNAWYQPATRGQCAQMLWNLVCLE